MGRHLGVVFLYKGEIMEKVIATRDLWNDGHDSLLILAGTTGRVIGRQKGDSFAPSVFIVTFADGNTTFCTADEILVAQ